MQNICLLLGAVAGEEGQESLITLTKKPASKQCFNFQLTRAVVWFGGTPKPQPSSSSD